MNYQSPNKQEGPSKSGPHIFFFATLTKTSLLIVFFPPLYRLAVGVGRRHVAGRPLGRRRRRAVERRRRPERHGQGAQPVGRHARSLVERAEAREQVYQQVNGSLTEVTRTRGRRSGASRARAAPAVTRAVGAACPSLSSPSTPTATSGTRTRTAPGVRVAGRQAAGHYHHHHQRHQHRLRSFLINNFTILIRIRLAGLSEKGRFIWKRFCLLHPTLQNNTLFIILKGNEHRS